MGSISCLVCCYYCKRKRWKRSQSFSSGSTRHFIQSHNGSLRCSHPSVDSNMSRPNEIKDDGNRVGSRASSYHTNNTLKLTAEDLDRITNPAVDTPEPISELPSDPPNVEERE